MSSIVAYIERMLLTFQLSWITAILVLIFGSYLLYQIVYYLHYCWILRKFKGPFPLPFVGNYYDLDALAFIKYMGKLRKKYGNIFTFFSLRKPFLMVCDPNAVRRILSDTKTFIKGDEYSTIFNLVFGEGLVTSNHEKHKDDRGVFGRFFVKGNLLKYMTLFNELVAEAMDEMLLNSRESNCQSHNIEDFFSILSLRSFGLFSMSVDFRKTPVRARNLCKVVSDGSNKIGMLIALGFFINNWNPLVKSVRKSRQYADFEFLEYVEERKALISKGDDSQIPDDCLTAMIKSGMSDKEIRDHVATLLSAGHDTTSFFCSFLIYALGRHQDIQDLVIQEIVSIVGDRNEITVDDVAQMKYLSKVMQETLRYYAIIPQVSRYATEEVHIKEAGVTIPKGVTIVMPLFLINRDPSTWENPSAFNPSRFDTIGNEHFTSAKNGFFPFGYGSRTCIGNTFAQLESYVFLCHLLRRFKISNDPNFKLVIRSGISLTTSNGINVLLTSRG